MGRAHITVALLGLAFTCCGASKGEAEPLRIALVIANSQYASFPGTTRCGPAAAMARDALRGKGFEILERSNLGRGEFDTAIGLLARRMAASPPAVAALYYCGYATEFNDRSFLLPVSAALSRDHDVLTQGIVVKSIVESLRRSPDGAGLVLLDVFPIPTAPAGRIGQLAEQMPASSFAIVAANNDSAGDGTTAASLALHDELAAGDASVGSVVNGLRRRLAKGSVKAQFINATSDASLTTHRAEKSGDAPSTASTSAAPFAASSSGESSPAPTSRAAPQQRPMVDEDRMSEQDRREVQTMLATLGYYSGRIDGAFGPETRAAIRRYQFEIKGELTGRLSAEQATRLVNGVR